MVKLCFVYNIRFCFTCMNIFVSFITEFLRFDLMLETDSDKPWMSESFKTTVDPLLKDLDGKKESFRRNVVSMAAEIKQVRGRLVSQEQSFVKERLFRKVSKSLLKCFDSLFGLWGQFVGEMICFFFNGFL